MSIIALPASARIRRVQWTLDRPTQANRSAYTGARRVVANPWHGKWAAQVELAPIVGEANVRPWRAFLAQLKGQTNPFQLPATEGSQYVAGTSFAAIANNANTTVSNLGGGVYSIQKTAGTTGVWNASAVSAVGMPGDFVLRLSGTGTAVEGGVNTDPLTDNADTSIDFAWGIFTGAGTWYVLQNGGILATLGPSGTYAWMWRTGSTLYWGRGTTLAAAQAAPDYSTTYTSVCYFDSSLNVTNDTLVAQLSYTLSGATVASGGAQGSNSLVLSTSLPLLAGMMVTVTLPSGNKQLLLLTGDISGSTITFEPPMRESAAVGAGVEAARPYALVALSDSAFGWSVDPGTQYGIAFNVEEAF